MFRHSSRVRFGDVLDYEEEEVGGNREVGEKSRSEKFGAMFSDVVVVVGVLGA